MPPGGAITAPSRLDAPNHSPTASRPPAWFAHIDRTPNLAAHPVRW